MTWQRAIILGDKRLHRRALGPWERRGRNALIAALVIGYVAWAVNATENRTLVLQALADISSIELGVWLFRADNGRCPENLNELLHPAEGAPYIYKDQDPWKQPYWLICPSRRDPGGAEVISGGPDRSLAGEDNILSL